MDYVTIHKEGRKCLYWEKYNFDMENKVYLKKADKIKGEGEEENVL